jgi:hypothetical protein
MRTAVYGLLTGVIRPPTEQVARKHNVPRTVLHSRVAKLMPMDAVVGEPSRLDTIRITHTRQARWRSWTHKCAFHQLIPARRVGVSGGVCT